MPVHLKQSADWVELKRLGLGCSIQDAGRWGGQASGVSVGGALNPYARQVANILVGNPSSAAVLECLAGTTELHSAQPRYWAVCGRPSDCSVPTWRPVWAQTVRITGRAWVAVAGGFWTPLVLASRSYDPLLAMPPLVQHQTLPLGYPRFVKPPMQATGHQATGQVAPTWFVPDSCHPAPQFPERVRAYVGPEHTWLTVASQTALWQQGFRLSSHFSRMGARLEAAEPLQLAQVAKHASMLSSAVSAGTVQLPSSGQPIILLAAAQTMGGYPRIAQVAQVDLAVLAYQPKQIDMQPITLEAAEQLLRVQQQFLQGVQARVEYWYAQL